MTPYGAPAFQGRPPHGPPDLVLRRSCEARASKDDSSSAVQNRLELATRARYHWLNDEGDDLGGASIYILLCSDGSYYAGITRRSVEERVSEHAQGLMPGYTFTRRPVKRVISEHYDRIVDAIAAERPIRGDFSAMVALSKRGSKAR
jgi:putative endonuclease